MIPKVLAYLDVSIKRDIADRAKELAETDMGITSYWCDELKAKTLQAADMDVGFLAVASAVLQAERARAAEAELRKLKAEYSGALDLLDKGNYEQALKSLKKPGGFSLKEQPFECGDEVFHRLSGLGEIVKVEGRVLHIRFHNNEKTRQMVNGRAPLINRTYLQKLLSALG